METTETDLASEINSGFRQQMLEWRLQYVAWAALYGLLIAILFGLLGKGPLSKTELSVDDGGMQIRYERFLRRHTPDSLRVNVLATGDTVEVRLDSQYVRHIRIETITPQPERVIAAEDALVFRFNAKPGATMQAVFEFRPEAVGRLKGWIAADGRSPLKLSQFVYP